MSRSRKVAFSILVLAAAAALVGVGTYSAFSATTTNSGNNITAGTVVLGDNALGAAMYNVSNQKPGDSFQQCIKVDYTGSLSSTVKLYTTSAIGSLGQYIDLQVRTGSGSPTFPGCTGFTPDASDIYSGTLANFATTYNSYANGLLDAGPGSNTSWVNGNSVVYRFTLTLQSTAPDTAQGATTGSHTFTWEARNS
jgi:predicted ribosomally synthesized peptide with SipW-like signal peptide